MESMQDSAEQTSGVNVISSLVGLCLSHMDDWHYARITLKQCTKKLSNIHGQLSTQGLVISLILQLCPGSSGQKSIVNLNVRQSMNVIENVRKITTVSVAPRVDPKRDTLTHHIRIPSNFSPTFLSSTLGVPKLSSDLSNCHIIYKKPLNISTVVKVNLLKSL